MHDNIRLGYLGLNDHEVRVIKSMFTLSPELKESFLLTGTAELDKADLVLVNVDDPGSISQWNQITRVNKLVTPMALSASGRSISGVVPLALPIRLNKLLDALKTVILESTQAGLSDSSSEAGAGFHILVVDDSFPVRKYMEQKLAELSSVATKLSFAESGEEAMEKFNNESFDMVFLDVMMEGVDGYKVCKAIKAKYKSYVVMLTSKKSPFDKVRGTMSGCNAFITKPPTDQRLVEEVEKCVKIVGKKQAKI
jgi:twitching motility two-component system response regulator PilG